MAADQYSRLLHQVVVIREGNHKEFLDDGPWVIGGQKGLVRPLQLRDQIGAGQQTSSVLGRLRSRGEKCARLRIETKLQKELAGGFQRPLPALRIETQKVSLADGGIGAIRGCSRGKQQGGA